MNKAVLFKIWKGAVCGALKTPALSMILFLAVPSFALNIEAVFENQKKSAFPDTCEMRMRTTVQFPGQVSQVVESSVVAVGESKSVTTVKSSLMRMKIVRNGNRIKATDLKTGEKLPTQNIPAQNPVDMNGRMGSPEDYNAPVKIADAFWEITPKDSAKPILYYSAKLRRIVKMKMPVNGTTATTEFEYCDNSCELPGTLKKVTIGTALPQGGESSVVLEILKVKRRHVLPSKMFDVD